MRKGVPVNHLRAIGNYTVAKKPDVIIFMGDHWDMPSLSHYDVGTLKAEGGRYQDDIKAGIKAMELFLDPIKNTITKRKKNRYEPGLVFLCLATMKTESTELLMKTPNGRNLQHKRLSA